jgi:hypothetical protein
VVGCALGCYGQDEEEGVEGLKRNPASMSMI